MAIKVLVSGAGGDVGQGVLKALASSEINIECYATCITKHSAGLYMGAEGYLAPLSSSEDYIPFLIRLIKKRKIDVFVPTVDGEIKKISSEKSRIELETGAKVFVDDINKIAITDDKLETSRYLEKNGFPHPLSISAGDPYVVDFLKKNTFPLIVKRRTGRGSQDVFIAKTIDDIQPFLGNPKFMLQEWLDPTQGEYTSGIYIGNDGYIKGACTFCRKLKGGSTFVAKRIVERELEKPLEEIALSLGLKYLNIQSMKRGRVLIPFEINGRLSGTTSIVSQLFNPLEMFIRENLLGEPLQRIENHQRFVAMRFYEEVYTNLDEVDCLVSRSADI